MKRLGQNHDGYHGETIDIGLVLADADQAAERHGWERSEFGRQGEFPLRVLRRTAAAGAPRLYISAGIHGDEPAGPLAALRLLEENDWPAGVTVCLLPCLNPVGFTLNRREHTSGRDLNRDYRQPTTPEIRAHTAWLDRESAFDLSLCLHEDWESHGFYLYEVNPDQRPSVAAAMVSAAAEVCPIDLHEVIEGRAAKGGIIIPKLTPAERPEWPEAIYLITHLTRLSYTLEAPSDFPLPTRVAALVAATKAAARHLVTPAPPHRSSL